MANIISCLCCLSYSHYLSLFGSVRFLVSFAYVHCFVSIVNYFDHLLLSSFHYINVCALSGFYLIIIVPLFICMLRRFCHHLDIMMIFVHCLVILWHYLLLICHYSIVSIISSLFDYCHYLYLHHIFILLS